MLHEVKDIWWDVNSDGVRSYRSDIRLGNPATTMNTYLSDLARVCTQNDVAYRILDRRESEEIRNDIRKKYPGVSLGSPIDFYTHVGLQHDEPWTLLSKILGDSAVYLLFPYNQERSAVSISNGSALAKLIDDVGYLFEYIITDEARSFLLGEHHAGILIAAGKAEDWVNALKKHQEIHRK